MPLPSTDTSPLACMSRGCWCYVRSLYCPVFLLGATFDHSHSLSETGHARGLEPPGNLGCRLGHINRVYVCVRARACRIHSSCVSPTHESVTNTPCSIPSHLYASVKLVLPAREKVQSGWKVECRPTTRLLAHVRRSSVPYTGNVIVNYDSVTDRNV